jgi:hypothetical protein
MAPEALEEIIDHMQARLEEEAEEEEDDADKD